MVASDPPLSGEELLAAVTEAMVALHERYYHRTPVNAKTRMLGDDLLACVLGGIYTEVEQTMIELERSTVVQETRSAFQTAMQSRFIDRSSSYPDVTSSHSSQTTTSAPMSRSSYSCSLPPTQPGVDRHTKATPSRGRDRLSLRRRPGVHPRPR